MKRRSIEINFSANFVYTKSKHAGSVPRPKQMGCSQAATELFEQRQIAEMVTLLEPLLATKLRRAQAQRH
jgi:hypothetical protein